ncbi:LacI family DNA-binding transcriptional regulator [Actinoplanes aureus]|nr:LacI family DNA-binding transcriptional regulator [Actinoplanes aureus]
MSAPRVTSADVARAAGVSRATVSFVLNDTEPGRVSETTRQRVRDAAARLGYVSHAAARSLRAGRSNLVLMPATQAAIGRLVSDWLDDLQQGLHRHGYTLVLHGGHDSDPVDLARSWAELRPAAVAVPGMQLTPAAVDLLRNAGVGVVLALSPEAVPGAYTVIFRHDEAGRLAVEHLAQRGRRRIAVVMPQERGLDLYAGQRLAGARQAAATHGVQITPVPLAYRLADAARLARSWHDSGWDAVFGYNDDYALLLTRALQDEGLDVPGDVAVVGADDLLVAQLARPRLTSIAFDTSSGAELAALIDRLIQQPGTEPGVLHTAAMRLVERDSS